MEGLEVYKPWVDTLEKVRQHTGAFILYEKAKNYVSFQFFV